MNNKTMKLCLKTEAVIALKACTFNYIKIKCCQSVCVPWEDLGSLGKTTTMMQKELIKVQQGLHREELKTL